VTGPWDIEGQVQALLARVERSTQERCAAAQAQAAAQARQILTSARAEARESVHRAVALERSRLDQALRRAQAQADLEQRQREQAHIKEMLGEMWRQLPGLLAARWRDPGARRGWIAAAFDEAGTLFPQRGWTIEHGGDIPQSEHSELEAAARGRGAAEVTFRHEPQMGPGLRIRVDGACLAATIPGLLARRADIESAFLADYLGDASAAAAQGGEP
jgi:hypothetical protein